MNIKRWGLFLEPLDVLFFRDGRPFGPAMQGHSGLPVPQTLAGAVCTALLEERGTDWLRFSETLREGAGVKNALDAVGQPQWIADVAVRGPWFAVRDRRGAVQDVLVPAPAVLRQVKRPDAGGPRDGQQASARLPRLQPLRARQLPGWQPPKPGMCPLWCAHPGALEGAQGFLNQNGLRAFLAGEDVVLDDLVAEEMLSARDRRTGIGIDFSRLVAQEGLIYAAHFLALRPGVGFYAEVLAPEEASEGGLFHEPTMAFGGEGRRVGVQVQPQPWTWPEATPRGADQRPLALLTTPGLFAQRWYPQAIEPQMVAAAVPGDVPVSGWDLARGGPKRTRFAARPGSVYFLNEPLADWPAVLSDDPFDGQQGWGCYLKGVWTDE